MYNRCETQFKIIAFSSTGLGVFSCLFFLATVNERKLTEGITRPFVSTFKFEKTVEELKDNSKINMTFPSKKINILLHRLNQPKNIKPQQTLTLPPNLMNPVSHLMSSLMLKKKAKCAFPKPGIDVYLALVEMMKLSTGPTGLANHPSIFVVSSIWESECLLMSKA